MARLTQRQVLQAFKLLKERNEWFSKHHAPLAAYEKHPKIPTRLTIAVIAQKAGTSNSTLARLQRDDFYATKWDDAATKDWVKKFYPKTSK